MRFIVLDGVNNLVIKILQQFPHDVIVPIGNTSNHSLAFPLSEQGNRRSLTASGSTSFMHIYLISQ
jgi:hypothetical protein